MVEPFRFISRKANQLHFVGDLSTWPLDVPLPKHTRVAGLGIDPIPPFWTFTLEETHTLEQLQGVFLLPLDLRGGDKWFGTELPRHGWQEVERSHFPVTTIRCGYRHTDHEQWRLRVHLHYNEDSGETRAMIWRIITHPYPDESANLPSILPHAV